ncbi:MAG: adenylate cyclase regulatory domain-containing protein, partial [Mycobacterium sp.]
MAEDFDIEASGLLDGLDGKDRAERAELVEWLLGEGFTVEQIRASFMPMLLAARRVLGEDGTYVSARETCEKTGVDLELLQRLQRAMGLPTVDDPDAAVHLRADAEAAAYGQHFIELGIEPDQLVLITRLLADGLSRAAEVMRYAGLETVLDPTASELTVARDAEALIREAAPLLGPMIQEMLRLQLRHLMETEAISASERAEGQRLPGARLVSIAFADLVGFTRLGEVVPPEELEGLAH